MEFNAKYIEQTIDNLTYDVLSVNNFMSKRSRTPKFLLTLHNILKNQEIRHIIHWHSSGKYFTIIDSKSLELQVLHLYFKSGNYASFIKQLNDYKFKLTKDESSNTIFSHPFFTRDNKRNLSKMTRKSSEKQEHESAFLEEKLILEQLQIEQQAIFKEYSNQVKKQIQLQQRIQTLLQMQQQFKFAEQMDELFQSTEFNQVYRTLPCFEQMKIAQQVQDINPETQSMETLDMSDYNYYDEYSSPIF